MPKVEISLNGVKIEAISQAAQLAALETVAALRGEVVSAQVMPFDTGNMQNNSTGISQNVQGEEIHTALATDTPYTRRMYFHPEYNFQKVNNPNAQGLWLKPWLPGGDREGFLPEIYENRLKERMPK